MAMIDLQFMSLEGMKFYCSFVGEGEEEACDAEATHFGSATDDFIEDGGRICETITFSCDAHPDLCSVKSNLRSIKEYYPLVRVVFGFRQRIRPSDSGRVIPKGGDNTGDELRLATCRSSVELDACLLGSGYCRLGAPLVAKYRQLLH